MAEELEGTGAAPDAPTNADQAERDEALRRLQGVAARLRPPGPPVPGQPDKPPEHIEEPSRQEAEDGVAPAQRSQVADFMRSLLQRPTAAQVPGGQVPPSPDDNGPGQVAAAEQHWRDSHPPTPATVSGFTGDIPGMPQFSDGAPIPPSVAAGFAGRGGYVSPIQADNGGVVANNNGVIASREGPTRQLSAAEYNALPRPAGAPPAPAFGTDFNAARLAQPGNQPKSPTNPGGVPVQPTSNQPAGPDDRLNPLIMALGGPVRGGIPGQIPTFQQARQAVLNATQGQQDMSPLQYSHILAQSGSQQLGQGRLGIEGRQADTAQFQAQTGRQAVDFAGRPDQRDADIAARSLYKTSLDRSHVEHAGRTPEQHDEAAEAESGVPTARFRQLTGILHPTQPPGPPLPPGAAGAAGAPRTPTAAPVDPSQPHPNGAQAASDRDERIRKARNTGDNTRDVPWRDIENELNAASGYVPATVASGNRAATPETPPNTTIGEFINRLETTNKHMLATHFPAVRDYAIRRWNESAVNEAVRRSQSPTQTDDRANSSIGAQMLSWMQKTGQLFRQPTDEEQGLSVLGHLNTAVRAAGSHENFLRIERAKAAAAAAAAPPGPPVP